MNIALITSIVIMINFLCWTTFDYYGFYVISNINFQVKDLVLIVCFFISIILSLINLWLSIIASLLEIVIFYLWFKNRHKSKTIVLGSILIVQIIDVFGDILLNILQTSATETIHGLLISELTNLVLLGIFFILILNSKKNTSTFR